MWNTLTIAFNILGVVLLYQFVRYKIADYRSCGDTSAFWKFSRHKYVTTVVGTLLVTLMVVEWLLPETNDLAQRLFDHSINTYLGVFAAASISAIWAVYLRKLDIFDPERWSNMFYVFAGGCITVWLVFPISNFLKSDLGFTLNGEVVNDFVYCVVGIGMVEELVKLLPLLIIVRYKTIVREPYDFLLYASLSALGFAFIENTLYIIKSNFFSINGRALTATVAHMTFSSVIGYSVMISIYKKSIWGWRYFIGGFLLASLMHGFYDFWLINPSAKALNGLTLLFFLLTTHFWFSMKNRTINASRFFSRHRKLINDKLQYFLIRSFTFLLLFSTLMIGLFHGKTEANHFLQGQLFSYGFLIYYLSFKFSRFKIMPRMLNGGQRVIEAVIPKGPDEATIELNR